MVPKQRGDRAKGAASESYAATILASLQQRVKVRSGPSVPLGQLRPPAATSQQAVATMDPFAPALLPPNSVGVVGSRCCVDALLFILKNKLQAPSAAAMQREQEERQRRADLVRARLPPLH